MGLKSQSQSVGGKSEALTLQVGESAMVLVDCDREAREFTRHALAKGGACAGAGNGCKYCAADIPKSTKFIVNGWRQTDDGELVPVSLWFRSVELGRFGDVLPDTGKCLIRIEAVAVIGDNGKPKASPGGRLWTDWRYVLVSQDTPRAGDTVTATADLH